MTTERFINQASARLDNLRYIFSEENIMPNKHPLLSRSFLALLLSLSSTLTFAAVQQSPIAGHWEGAIKLPTGSLNFSVDFTVASDGKVVLTNLNGTPLRDLI